jgi:sulfotransferase
MKIFYQSSLPRSGSTLLQNILAQNPAFYVTPTSGVLDLIFGARVNYTNGLEFKAQDSRLMEKAFLSFCRAGMEGFYQGITDRPYILDKSRGWGVHFDLLRAIFQCEPRVICMVRDLRQIAASFEKRFRKNPATHKPIENHVSMEGITTYKRVVQTLQTIPLGLALERLFEVHTRGFASKMLFLRYEDMVLNPASTMKQIYNYLQLPEFAHNFEHVAQVTQEDDSVFESAGLHDIRPKVAPLPSDFLQILGPPAVQYIESNFAWYFERFGYPLARPRT